VTPRPSPASAAADWHRDLARAIRDPGQLLERLELPVSLADHPAAKLFGVMVPESFLARMRPGDPHDPLLRQVLPDVREHDRVEGFTIDAVGDQAARRTPGLIHKYAGRALLVSTGSCAVHCRYCFRRHYPYGREPRRLDEWKPAIDALQADDSIREVILSGGDPLMLTDARLGELLDRLDAIPHLARLRIHTRLPIVLPSRVTPALCRRLQSGRLTPIVVVHANHPAEVVGDCVEALVGLVRSGLPVLNQAVLLAGVNDDADTLEALCSRLADTGVVAYYLHQLDRVAGAAHFETDESVGRALIAELERRLPGYAVPRYVREQSGESSKRRLV